MRGEIHCHCFIELVSSSTSNEKIICSRYFSLIRAKNIVVVIVHWSQIVLLSTFCKSLDPSMESCFYMWTVLLKLSLFPSFLHFIKYKLLKNRLSVVHKRSKTFHKRLSVWVWSENWLNSSSQFLLT